MKKPVIRKRLLYFASNSYNMHTKIIFRQENLGTKNVSGLHLGPNCFPRLSADDTGRVNPVPDEMVLQLKPIPACLITVRGVWWLSGRASDS